MLINMSGERKTTTIILPTLGYQLPKQEICVMCKIYQNASRPPILHVVVIENSVIKEKISTF